MSAIDTRRAFRPSARRRLASNCCGIKHLILSTLALSLMAGATTALLAQPAATPHWSKLVASPDLTIRYLFLAAVPRADAPAESKKGENVPAGLLAINTAEGSRLTMGPTLETYLAALKAQGAEHYDWRVMAAGDVSASKDGVYSIQSEASPDDPFQGTVTDRIVLTKVAPNVVEASATGSYTQSQNDSSRKSTARFICSWAPSDSPSPRRELGNTYTPSGIELLPNGVRFIYAYCILPGKPDETLDHN